MIVLLEVILGRLNKVIMHHDSKGHRQRTILLVSILSPQCLGTVVRNMSSSVIVKTTHASI